MADIIATGTSGYATGSIDTASTVVNNVTAIDAVQPNGLAAAVIQLETILGVGTTLKGSAADLVTRLAIVLEASGLVKSGTAIPAPVLSGTTTGTYTLGGTPTFTSPTIDTPTINTPTITSPTVSGTLSGTLTGGTITTTLSGCTTAGTWTGNSIGTGGLKTSTGSASGQDNVIVSITMNDYAFAPATFDESGGGSPVAIHCYYGTDPSNTVARFSLPVSGGTGASSKGMRWRYFTASDNPVIWVAYDSATGMIVGSWASDDPTPGDVPGIVVPGCASTRLTAKDLESFSVLSGKAKEAGDLIRAKKQRMQHQAYRALQLYTNDDAPSKWLLDNCHVNTVTGKFRMKTLLER